MNNVGSYSEVIVRPTRKVAILMVADLNLEKKKLQTRAVLSFRFHEHRPQKISLKGKAFDSYSVVSRSNLACDTGDFHDFPRSGWYLRSRQFPSSSLPNRYSLISLALDATHLNSQITRRHSMVRRVYNSNYFKFNYILKITPYCYSFTLINSDATAVPSSTD
jgi:hypothetical protein